MRRVRALLGVVVLGGSVLVVGAPPGSADPAPADCTIVGTNGPDVLVGTPGPDVICGRGGNDTLQGRDGNDILDGGTGKDEIHGGKGDDLVRASDGAVDKISCGKGDDRVVRDDGDAARNCETRVPDVPVDPTKMRAYGPGLEGGTGGQETYFSVETVTPTGQKVDVPFDLLAVRVTGPRGEVLPVTIADGGDAVVSVRYTPIRGGLHTVVITWDGVQIANSPFHVNIDKDPEGIDPSKSRAYGPGLEGGTVGATSTFFLELNRPSGQRYLGDTSAVVITAVGPDGADVPLTRSVKEPGTLQLGYLPTQPGTYTISVSLDSEQVPGSPFAVPVS
jgi:hypothetical protein